MFPRCMQEKVRPPRLFIGLVMEVGRLVVLSVLHIRLLNVLWAKLLPQGHMSFAINQTGSHTIVFSLFESIKEKKNIGGTRSVRKTVLDEKWSIKREGGDHSVSHLDYPLIYKTGTQALNTTLVIITDGISYCLVSESVYPLSSQFDKLGVFIF